MHTYHYNKRNRLFMKQDRIALRTSQKERERLSEAAIFTGMTLSCFLRQAALEKSDEVLKNRDNITLSDRDRDLFLNALENPPKPNERLKKAFKNYENKKNGINTSRPSTKRHRSEGKRTKAVASKKR
jgi:uncharacterized protein (DUF1778 family)